MLTKEDISVIVDHFLEKLPAVWEDAYNEIVGGKSVNEVVYEMKDGHVLRILRRLGYDVEWFIADFIEFMNHDH
jgi:hypothetical protein